MDLDRFILHEDEILAPYNAEQHGKARENYLRRCHNPEIYPHCTLVFENDNLPYTIDDPEANVLFMGLHRQDLVWLIDNTYRMENPAHDDKCVICDKDSTDQSFVATTLCHHIYHRWCLREWQFRSESLGTEVTYCFHCCQKMFDGGEPRRVELKERKECVHPPHE